MKIIKVIKVHGGPLKEVGHKEAKTLDLHEDLFLGHQGPWRSSPMSLDPKRHHASTDARVSPGLAQGPRVVSLRAWREAHGSSANARSNVRPVRLAAARHSQFANRGLTTTGPRIDNDRLGRVLAWCQAYTTTGRNPFDPARLQGDA